MKVEEIDQRKINLIKSGRNFLGILNDIKRRPEDAANELKISLEKINSILSGDSELTAVSYTHLTLPTTPYV